MGPDRGPDRVGRVDKRGGRVRAEGRPSRGQCGAAMPAAAAEVRPARRGSAARYAPAARPWQPDPVRLSEDRAGAGTKDIGGASRPLPGSCHLRGGEGHTVTVERRRARAVEAEG